MTFAIRLAVALAVVSCWQTNAAAQTETAPADVVAQQQDRASSKLPPRAAQLYQEAAALYRLGKFKPAAAKFRAALAIANRPSLLFNIAQCYRQLGQRQEAIFYYRLYLSESERVAPNEPVPFGSEVKARVQKLEAAAAASRVVDRKSPVAAAAAPETRPVTRCERTASACPPFYKRWWFWTLVGVAVAGAATSTVLALQPDTTVAPVGSIPPGRIDLSR